MELASIASGSSGNCIYIGNQSSHFLVDAGISRKRIVEGLSDMALQPEDIVVVKIEDCSWEGDQKPSSEKGIHADVYRTRPGVNFVIHTHQAAASAWSILGKHISAADLMISQDNGAEQIRILGGGIPCAAYGLSGTKKLRENVARMTQEYPESRAVLMRNHGALCMGRDEDEAFEVAHTLEQVCEKLYQDKTGIIFHQSAQQWQSIVR